MTFGIVTLAMGYMLGILGIAMVVPALVDLAWGSPDWKTFAVSALFTLFAAGTLILASRGSSTRMSLRQGFILTVVSWLTASAFAALPFLFSGLRIDFADSFFEAISGLTTTGSTILSGLDGMPPGLLVWRSMLQWVGGIGIIVMGIVMLPFLRIGGMQLFRLESSDRSSEKILPRPGQLAAWIGGIYLALTLGCTLLFYVFGMSGFDAINHAMTTVSTGGYSTHDASLGHFASPAIFWSATVFMVLGALPFGVYIVTVRRNAMALLRDTQVRGFIALLAVVWAVLTLWRVATSGEDWFAALTAVAVNTTSVITTTGFATEDYTLWGAAAVGSFFMLTFLGGCAGSTSGGFKTYRLQIAFAMLAQTLRSTLTPHGVFPTRYGGRKVEEDVRESVAGFAMLYALTIAALALVLSFIGLDFATAVSGALTAVANVGPGVGTEIGPAGNFAALPDSAKWALSIGMLMGRLEIVTVLVLLAPESWRG